MLRNILSCIVLAAVLVSCDDPMRQVPTNYSSTSLRAPAYPLITIDPYTSAWSTTDSLFGSPVKHWTGKPHSLIGAIRVDGKVYRFMGKEQFPLKNVLPMAPWDGAYTEKKPASGWEQPTFDAKQWKTGKSAFGSPGMKAINTEWPSKEIWVRREFVLPQVDASKPLYLIYSHDDDFELYLNGKQIINTGHSAKHEVVFKLDPALLNKDKNVIAAHCTNTGGLAYVDFGIFTDGDQTEIFTTTAKQDSIRLTATSTIYNFTAGPIALELAFTAPLLTSDLDLMSRPVNYVNYTVNSNDDADHEVAVYFEMTPEWAVNEPEQPVSVTRGEAGELTFLKAGTVDQKILERKGDNVRIDWGYAYLAANKSDSDVMTIGNYADSKTAFITDGTAGATVESVTGSMTEKMPVMALVQKLDKKSFGGFMIAYEDIQSIQYFGENLPAWWTKDGSVKFLDILTDAKYNWASIKSKCLDFDKQLWDETFKAGGKKYADLCVLAYRQSIAAHKLVKDKQGNLLFLSKENFSNGSIGTVDITYPSAPMYLHYNPELLKGMMNPIFYYSESGKWTKPFAAHDVGTYPQANGQTYGDDMPVEESGNMLILTAALAEVEGNAKYAEQHWAVLTTWADYLLKNGLDPENQLCTDDFAGHFAHNANLSIKAIMGIASYSRLAKMLQKDDVSLKYGEEAKRMATEWEKMANDGDHYRLTFDQKGTWSQKYNLVWDKLLRFNIFPPSIAEKELAYYLTKQNTYGLPLDNRRTYTKSDWIVWTATLANDQATFENLIDPVHAYVLNSPTRVPMSDWYETTDAKQVGFQARSVVGGYFIKLLEKK